MAVLSGEQVAQHLYNAGFRGEDLVNMVAIAKRESSFRSDAHRTDRPRSAMSGDMGLLQINYTNWNLVSSRLGLSSKQELFDPAINARAAKVLFDEAGGLAPWTMGPNGWQAGGDPFRGTNRNEARSFVANMGGVSNTPGAEGVTTAGAPSDQTGPVTIPGDMEIVTVTGPDGVDRTYAIKMIGTGTHISFEVPSDSSVSYDGARVKKVTQEESDRVYGRGVPAGSVLELAGVEENFGGFTQMWDSVVNTVLGAHNPAINDAGVMAVIAQRVARPDMTDAEFTNLLKGTDWFQNRTEAELQWNDLGGAEQDKVRDETAAQMRSAVFNILGVDVDPDDPRIANYLEDVASGRMGLGQYGNVLRDMASDGDYSESPEARRIRDEQEQQKKRPIDIENTALRVRELTERWGVQWSAQTIRDWAKRIVGKDSSDEDLIMELRAQAQVLYPWKDPDVETATAASPWIETYRRVMESPGSLSTPEIAKAMQAGRSVFDFETELKKSSGWLETKNGRDTMYSTISELGARMGYV